MRSLAQLLEIASPPLGPPLDQVRVGRLPAQLRPLLGTTNGFFAFEQALLVLPSGVGDVALESWNDPAGWIASYEGLADGMTFFAMDLFGGQFGISRHGLEESSSGTTT